MLKNVFKGLNVENVYEGVGKEHLEDILSLTGLNASVYTDLNAQKL